MRTGSLRHKITVQQNTRTQDSTGAWSPGSWTTLRAPWADARKMSGTERAHAEQTISDAEWKFTMHYADGKDIVSGKTGNVEHRVSYGGKLFNILDVNNVGERNEVIVLTCSEARA